MTSSKSQTTNGIGLGIVVVLIAIVALVAAREIRVAGLGDNHDPGPRFLPIALGVGLLIWGVAEIVRGALNRRASAPRVDDSDLMSASSESHPVRATAMVVAMAVYIAALGWLGFSVATFLFAGGVMMLLRTRWYLAVPVAAGLVAAVQMLFAYLFQVRLPSGQWGLPF